MSQRDIGELMRQALSLAGRAPAGRLASSLPPASLFDVLRDSADREQRAAAERSIWQQWCSHEHADAEAAMERVLLAIEGRQLRLATTLLGRLVVERPLWAEARNRCALVHFLLGDDVASVLDIRRTLELEPRHFGALAGLGRIALRNGDGEAALGAFEQALALNPNLDQLREAAAALRTPGAGTLH